MYARTLEMDNFRNYEKLFLEMCDGVNLFEGGNAQGKTNILEAVMLASCGRSQRMAKDREMIRHGHEEAHIRLCVSDSLNTSSHSIDIHLRRTMGKGAAIDRVPLAKISELFGICRTVIFSPEDIRMIKGEPGWRRRFVDMELCQIDRAYAKLLANYGKVLNHRNHLLKEMAYRPSLADTLEMWDRQLAIYGIPVVRKRSEFVEKLAAGAQEIYGELTAGSESLRIFYEPNAAPDVFEEHIRKNHEKEIKAGMTLTGPHRDDIGFEIDGLDARRYGSQGQQKSVAIALKIAEIRTIKNISREYPILLLDEILAELDKKRQVMLLSMIRGMQTLITCTGMEDFVRGGLDIDRKFNVVNGTVKRG